MVDTAMFPLLRVARINRSVHHTILAAMAWGRPRIEGDGE